MKESKNHCKFVLHDPSLPSVLSQQNFCVEVDMPSLTYHVIVDMSIYNTRVLKEHSRQ